MKQEDTDISCVNPVQSHSNLIAMTQSKATNGNSVKNGHADLYDDLDEPREVHTESSINKTNELTSSQITQEQQIKLIDDKEADMRNGQALKSPEKEDQSTLKQNRTELESMIKTDHWLDEKPKQIIKQQLDQAEQIDQSQSLQSSPNETMVDFEEDEEIYESTTTSQSTDVQSKDAITVKQIVVAEEGEDSSLSTPDPKEEMKSDKHREMSSCTVELLNGGKFECPISNKTLGQEVFDKTCDYLILRERQYFGLTYVDADDVRNWINLEKRLCKQLKNSKSQLHFEVKFFPEPTDLKENITRFFFSLQIRNNLLSEKISCLPQDYAILGSYLAQSEFGNFDAEKHLSKYSDGFKFAPHSTPELLKQLAEVHKLRRGLSAAEADLAFLKTAKKLNIYGLDFYPVSDSNGPLMIGVCTTGLNLYRNNECIERFDWPKIQKVSYNLLKFCVKIRRPDGEESNIEFELKTQKAAKCLWKIVVDHHTFYKSKQPVRESRPSSSELVKQDKQEKIKEKDDKSSRHKKRDRSRNRSRERKKMKSRDRSVERSLNRSRNATKDHRDSAKDHTDSVKRDSKRTVDLDRQKENDSHRRNVNLKQDTKKSRSRREEDLRKDEKRQSRSDNTDKKSNRTRETESHKSRKKKQKRKRHSSVSEKPKEEESRKERSSRSDRKTDQRDERRNESYKEERKGSKRKNPSRSPDRTDDYDKNIHKKHEKNGTRESFKDAEKNIHESKEKRKESEFSSKDSSTSKYNHSRSPKAEKKRVSRPDYDTFWDDEKDEVNDENVSMKNSPNSKSKEPLGKETIGKRFSIRTEINAFKSVDTPTISPKRNSPPLTAGPKTPPGEFQCPDLEPFNDCSPANSMPTPTQDESPKVHSPVRPHRKVTSKPLTPLQADTNKVDKKEVKSDDIYDPEAPLNSPELDDSPNANKDSKNALSTSSTSSDRQDTKVQSPTFSPSSVPSMNKPVTNGVQNALGMLDPTIKIVLEKFFKSAQMQPNQQQQSQSTGIGGKFKKPAPVSSGKGKTIMAKQKHVSNPASFSVNLNTDIEEVPSSAVELQIREKYIKKLNRQERVVEEVKCSLKPFYQRREISKEEYKGIMRKAVPKICHSKTGEINPVKIKQMVERYIAKVKHARKTGKAK